MTNFNENIRAIAKFAVLIKLFLQNLHSTHLTSKKSILYWGPLGASYRVYKGHRAFFTTPKVAVKKKNSVFSVSSA